MSDTIIKIEHVSKQYRLGAIGGGTLKGDLQSLMARIRGKEDPNALVGTGPATRQRFWALNDVSFSVKKGERVGIIGHNGAGKSTLLKLLSRVTAPTEGTISYNGRIASMLEVGTGFHPELTGRENIYLNCAILGMTKAEIAEKFDDIVRFAEMEKFVDTPVKRYSSGMYVKLAFAVAAHLDSDILVMDEVLAVGDMKFQQKCLGKMDDVSKHEGKTVLYVSHNMNTIRQLCSRCIVMDHGKVIFDGDVEQAIGIYMNNGAETEKILHLDEVQRHSYLPKEQAVHFTYAEYLDNGAEFYETELPVRLRWRAEEGAKNVHFRFEFRVNGTGVATAFTAKSVDVTAGEQDLHIDISCLVPAVYEVSLVAYQNVAGGVLDVDAVKLPMFHKVLAKGAASNWNAYAWGHVRLPDIQR
jgi:lipopolysaccharide transport system ATP-binding protein